MLQAHSLHRRPVVLSSLAARAAPAPPGKFGRLSGSLLQRCRPLNRRLLPRCRCPPPLVCYCLLAVSDPTLVLLCFRRSPPPHLSLPWPRAGGTPRMMAGRGRRSRGVCAAGRAPGWRLASPRARSSSSAAGCRQVGMQAGARCGLHAFGQHVGCLLQLTVVLQTVRCSVDCCKTARSPALTCAYAQHADERPPELAGPRHTYIEPVSSNVAAAEAAVPIALGFCCRRCMRMPCPLLLCL